MSCRFVTFPCHAEAKLISHRGWVYIFLSVLFLVENFFMLMHSGGVFEGIFRLHLRDFIFIT